MSAESVGKQLVELCRAGKNLEAIDRLYADNIISIEAAEGPGFPRQITGKKEVRGKSEWWGTNNQVHSAEVKGPFPHGEDRFAVLFQYDFTNKQDGKRAKLEEVAVYHVGNGKVVREEFFFARN